MSENNGIAGQFVIGDGLQQGGVIEPGHATLSGGNESGPEVVHAPKNAIILARISPFLSEADIRRYIREEVHTAIYPGGTIDGHEHRRVEMVEESGKHWRGVLYRVDEEKPAQVPAGVCWACGEHGKSEDMMWLDQFGKRSHLIHATVECIRAAEAKPESREHRG